MELNRYLRYGLLAGIFLTLLIPFYVSDSMFFPFITGKNFAFRAIVDLMFAGWIALAWRDARYRLSWSWILAAAVLFLAVMGVADLFGVNPYRSFWSNYERMEGYVTTLHLFVYFIILSAVMNGEQIWSRFWHMLMGMSVFFGWFTILQIAGSLAIDQGGNRADATFGNATYLAAYMLFCIFITAILWYRNNRERSREVFYGWMAAMGLGVLWTLGRAATSGFAGAAALPWVGLVLMLVIGIIVAVAALGRDWKDRIWLMHILYGLAILLETFSLYSTATRGDLLGLLAGIFVAGGLIVFLERERPRVRKFGIGALVAVLIVVGGFFAIKNVPAVKDNPVLGRFSSISLSDPTTEARFVIWGMALKGWEARPILGWGQENFPYIFAEYYDPRMYGQEPWFDRAHDVFFDWLTAGGVLGLGAYLSIFLAALWYAWRSREAFSPVERSLIIGMLVGYFFQNLFVFDNLTSYLLYFAVLAYIHMRASERLAMPAWFARVGTWLTDGVMARRVAIPLAIVVSVVGLYMFVIEGVMQNTTLLAALRSYSDGGATNLALFKQALAYDTFGTMETREQLVQAATQIEGSQASAGIKKQFLDLASAEMIKETQEEPLNVRAKVFLGSLYIQTGDYSNAIQWFKKAHDESPNKQDISFGLGQAYLESGDIADALATFKAAYDEDPKLDQVALTYAAAAIVAHDQTLADQLLVQHYGTTTVTDQIIVNAYASTHQWAPLIAIWKTKIALNPTDTQSMLSLGATYYAAGDKADAIAELQVVEKVDPTSKQQIDGYIQQIQAGTMPQ